jgi:uncharacterized protein
VPGLDITPRLPAGRQLIQGYGNGGFRIAGEIYRGPVLILPERTVSWSVLDPEDIGPDALTEVTADATPSRILVVGCGRRFVPPPESLGESLREAGVALEWMDTGAACRTFNVLLIEGRDVAAALIAVP